MCLVSSVYFMVTLRFFPVVCVSSEWKNVLLYEFTSVCLSVLLWVDTRSVSSLGVTVSIAAVNILVYVPW